MILYRYKRGYYNSASLDKPTIFLDSYEVLSETKCGYWIETYLGRKWVSSSGKKRYAYPTKEEAYKAFIARTNRCIVLLKAQLKHAQAYAKTEMPDFDVHDNGVFDFID